MTPLWLQIAQKEIGTAEVPGLAVNPRIVEYNKVVGFTYTADEISWCSSFVCWCFEQCGITSTKSAAARSWLNWRMQLEVPREGCVTVLWRNNPDGWQGHVGFYVSENEKTITLLGGNQQNKVCLYEYPKQRLLGYRWPKKK